MNMEVIPEAEGPVLVIGGAGLDMVGQLGGELLHGTSNPARIRTWYGGVARNVAENLARLGQPVKLVAAVGTDWIGDQLLAQLEQAGVDVQHVLRSTTHRTGSYLAVTDARGDQLFALDDMTATLELSPAYLRRHSRLFKEASLIFMDANLSRDSLKTAISLARKWGKMICADPTSAFLANRYAPFLGDLYLIAPNCLEAGILVECEVDASDNHQVMDAAKKLVTRGVQTAIITQAEFGVCYATPYTSGQISAIHTEIIDTTGAGDALTAAVIFSLINQIPIDEAVRLGVSAATMTLKHAGAVYPGLSLEKLYDNW
jgi:pseudouridine kinase